MKLKVGACLVALFVWGCSQNPFPKEGTYTVERPVEIPPPVAVPPLILDIPETVVFTEGVAGEYKLEARVPEGGKPVIIATPLPEGAVYTNEDLTLRWTPPYGSANDPEKPLATLKPYYIKLTLFDEVDPKTIMTKTLTLLVEDNARPFTHTLTSSKPEALEGETFTQMLLINSPDFPTGPFKVQLDGAPPEAVLTRVPGNKKFSISYLPNFGAVTTKHKRDAQGYFREAEFTLRMALPNNVTAEEKVKWRIRDSRQKPQIYGPARITQGDDIQFTLTANDANAEVSPSIEAEAIPGFGAFSMTPLHADQSLASRFRQVLVKWNGIPPEKQGTSTTLKFKSCVPDKTGTPSLCSLMSTVVTFSTIAHKAPTIDRAGWAVGAVKYVRVGDVGSTPLPIKDGEGSTVKPTVKIYPSDASADIKWVDGKLTFTPRKAGILAFEVEAISAYSVRAVESFMFEALPSTWSRTLVLGNRSQSPEVQAFRTYFPGAYFINPASSDDRIFELRTLVIVTSEALSEPEGFDFWEQKASKAKHVILSSPLLANLKGPLKQELDALKIKAKERYLEITDPLPVLADFTMNPIAAGGLTAATLKLGLSGALTEESKSPLFLEYSGDKCKPLLNLEEATSAKSFLTSLLCPREGGGQLLVAGFEWGDLHPDPTEEAIPKTWMQTLVKP